MKPQAIFIDIDNTLIPYRSKNLTISLENTLVIKTAQKQGIYVVIASGRSYNDAIKVQKQLRFNEYGDYLISNNAASIDKVGEEPKKIWEKEIDPLLTNKIIEYGKKNNFLIKFSQDPKYYGHVKYKLLGYVLKKYGHEVVDYSLLDLSIEGTRRKMGIIPQTFSLKKIEQITNDLRNQFPELEIVLSGPGRFIEINEKNISKASGLKILAEDLDLDLGQCVAIGDSGNDVEMFKVVGIPIVMSNASPEVKKYAKFETIHAKKSGVAKAINSVYKMEQKDEY